MFIYVFWKELSSPNPGRTYEITSLAAWPGHNLTPTFNCTRGLTSALVFGWQVPSQNLRITKVPRES
jgi:hypothetical protein